MLAAIKPNKPIKQAVYHGLIRLTTCYKGAWFGGTKPSQVYQARRLIAACLLASLVPWQSSCRHKTKSPVLAKNLTIHHLCPDRPTSSPQHMFGNMLRRDRTFSSVS
jgi:hypothetical protein